MPLTKPALGMSADNGIVPTPYTSAPDIDGFACEDLRAACPGMAPDGGGPYGYYDLALGK